MGPTYVARTLKLDSAKSPPGFLGRTLLKDTENDDVYFYISMWTSYEALQAFRSSQVVTEVRQEAPLLEITLSVDRVTCEVLIDERVSVVR